MKDLVASIFVDKAKTSNIEKVATLRLTVSEVPVLCS